MATLHEHQQITVCRNYNLEFKKFYYNSMKKYNEHPNIIIKKNGQDMEVLRHKKNLRTEL